MAVSQPIYFGLGYTGQVRPVGVPNTQRLTGVDDDFEPGNPSPIAVGATAGADRRRYVRAIRFLCDGALQIAVEGTHNTRENLGPTIDLAPNVWHELAVDEGLVLFGGAPLPFDAVGFLLLPAIGSSLYCVGVP